MYNFTEVISTLFLKLFLPSRSALKTQNRVTEQWLPVSETGFILGLVNKVVFVSHDQSSTIIILYNNGLYYCVRRLVS